MGSKPFHVGPNLPEPGDDGDTRHERGATLPTPFDDVISDIRQRRYHNHRLEDHSNIVSQGVFRDLTARCDALRKDVEADIVRAWYNVPAPGDRKRKIDLFIGEAGPKGKPDVNKVRVAVENKSVVTAHRNRDARFDDLQKALKAIYDAHAETVMVATVMIGTSTRVLNIPDGVKKLYKKRLQEFEASIVPRLSSGDVSLWSEFDAFVSENSTEDPRITRDLMLKLPKRKAGHTHVVGYDDILLVPVAIDNVTSPSVARTNSLGIAVDNDYDVMIARMCKAYTARWHL